MNAHFFVNQQLPHVAGYADAITSGDRSSLDIVEDAFEFYFFHFTYFMVSPQAQKVC